MGVQRETASETVTGNEKENAVAVVAVGAMAERTIGAATVTEALTAVETVVVTMAATAAATVEANVPMIEVVTEVLTAAVSVARGQDQEGARSQLAAEIDHGIRTGLFKESAAMETKA